MAASARGLGGRLRATVDPTSHASSDESDSHGLAELTISGITEDVGDGRCGDHRSSDRCIAVSAAPVRHILAAFPTVHLSKMTAAPGRRTERHAMHDGRFDERWRQDNSAAGIQRRTDQDSDAARSVKWRSHRDGGDCLIPDRSPGPDGRGSRPACTPGIQPQIVASETFGRGRAAPDGEIVM